MPDKKQTVKQRQREAAAKNRKASGLEVGSEIFLGGESAAYKKAMGDAHGFGERKPSRKKPRPAKATQQGATPASESTQKMLKDLLAIASRPRMPSVIPEFGKPKPKRKRK